jgi:hypothetical protein
MTGKIVGPIEISCTGSILAYLEIESVIPLNAARAPISQGAVWTLRLVGQTGQRGETALF